MEYQPQNNYQNNYDNNYYPQDEYGEPADNTVKGLKIAIVILIVVLLALSFLFWNRVRMDKKDAEAMKEQMDTLQSQLGDVQEDLNTMTFANDSLNKDLEMSKFKADSLMQALKKEKNYRYSVVKKYEKELGSLRAIMQGFVRQIDSLNTVNKKLAGENVQYRKTIASYKTRVESAEETASELQTKVNRASQIRARGISMKLLNKKNKATKNVKSAKTIEVSFILSANELVNPGKRTVYVSLVNPAGAVISSSGRTVTVESQSVPYTESRDVDYTGEDLNVSVFCHSESFTSGSYNAIIYMDGTTIGSGTIIFK